VAGVCFLFVRSYVALALLGQNNETPLYLAAKNGRTAVVAYLQTMGANSATRTKDGCVCVCLFNHRFSFF
jgi:ankyrin repeat protein